MPKTEASNFKPVADLTFPELWEEYWRDRDSGDALARLLEVYLPLARKVLLRLMIRLPSHVKSEDHLNSALIGLHEAICRFDPAAGTSFEGFATRRIRGSVLDELRSVDPLSRTQREKLASVGKAMDAWILEHQSFPEENDLARVLNMSPDDLASLMEAGQPWLSLDAPIAINGRVVLLGETLVEQNQPTPDQEAQCQDARAFLRRAFRELGDREQKILYLYYYEELTLREIAEAFEVTEARVCQIHAMAIQKLKSFLTKPKDHLL